MTTYHKQLFENGELKSGMYTRGNECASLELCRQTKLLMEQPGATDKPSANRQVAIVDNNGLILELYYPKTETVTTNVVVT